MQHDFLYRNKFMNALSAWHTSQPPADSSRMISCDGPAIIIPEKTCNNYSWKKCPRFDFLSNIQEDFLYRTHSRMLATSKDLLGQLQLQVRRDTWSRHVLITLPLQCTQSCQHERNWKEIAQNILTSRRHHEKNWWFKHSPQITLVNLCESGSHLRTVDCWGRRKHQQRP